MSEATLASRATLKQSSSIAIASKNQPLAMITSRDDLHQIALNHQGAILTMCTPELAGWLLEMNTANRRLKRDRVNEHVRTIMHGAWVNTGEPIIVSRELILNEGQHRLNAIKIAGRAVELYIVFGVARSAFIATGTGATRTAADVLSIEHVKYATHVSSSARLLVLYDLGLPGSAALRLTSQEVTTAALHRWPEMPAAVGLAYRKLNQGTGSSKLMSGAGGAFTYLALQEANEARVSAFLDIVALGTTTQRDDPPRVLRQRLMSTENHTGWGRGNVEKLALYIKAWNAWKKHELTPSLRWRSQGERAEDFPTIEGVKI